MWRVLSIGAGALLLMAANPASPGAGGPLAQAYDPRSTAAAPCGVGVPPLGHLPREHRVSDGDPPLAFTVKQDGSRLCYVVNGIAEAPVIRVRQGSDLAIDLRNEITDPAAIQNFVAVRRLDDPNPEIPQQAGLYPVVPGMRHPATSATNLHVHGFVVPPTAPQDDVLHRCADPAVGPAACGQREIAYRYKIPADMPAGLYWYHPHVHGEVQAQMLMGLTGAIVVEGPEDDARRAAGIEDRILIVRQTQDNDAGATSPAQALAARLRATARPAPASPEMPAQSPAIVTVTDGNAIDTADELLCNSNSGVNEITLNGAKIFDVGAQDSELTHLEVPQGGRLLWRVLNGATDAFLDLALVTEDEAPLPIEIVARDGAPLKDDQGRLAPVPTTNSQLVPPAGRLEFLVSAPPPGKRAYLVSHAVDTGCAGDRVPARKLALVTAGRPSGAALPAEAEAASSPQPDLFSGLLSRKTDRERVIAMAEYPRAGSEDQTDFYIAERKRGAVLRPFEMEAPPGITVQAGTTEEWVVENWTHELHAFHIHQLHFRVLEIDGKPAPDTPLVDVVNVPYATAGGYKSKAGPVIPGTVRIKLSFPPELAGDIPVHCHLVDHEDNGMMAVVRVVPLQRASAAGPGGSRDYALLDRPPICRAAAAR